MGADRAVAWSRLDLSFMGHTEFSAHLRRTALFSGKAGNEAGMAACVYDAGGKFKLGAVSMRGFLSAEGISRKYVLAEPEWFFQPLYMDLYKRIFLDLDCRDFALYACLQNAAGKVKKGSARGRSGFVPCRDDGDFSFGSGVFGQERI